MYRPISLGWVLVCAVIASGEPVQDVSQALREAYPDVRSFSDGGQLSQVYGTTFGYGVSAERSADNFVRTYSQVFGVRDDELQPAAAGLALDTPYTLPLLYEEQTGTYTATMVCCQQHKDGIPVYRADLRMMVANDPAYPLVLANSTLCDLGDLAVPRGALARIDEGGAYAAALAFEPGLIDFSAAELVIWPDRDNKPSMPQVAITFVGSGLSANGEPKKFRFACAAATGEILHTEDMILFTTAAFNCTGFTQTKLRFWRWLGVESPTYDHAYVRVSNNGSTWTTVWQNTAQIADSAWTQVEYDISAVADNKSTVYVRWTMGTTDSSWQFCGWNLDDVQIVATSALHLTEDADEQSMDGTSAPATPESDKE